MVLHIIGKFPRRTKPTNNMWLSKFRTYDFTTKLCSHYAGVIQNHDNEKFATLNKKKHTTLKIICLHMAAIKFMTVEMCNYHYDTA